MAGSSPAMTNLLCFGLGYTARHFVAQHGDAYERVAGTVRESRPSPDAARPVTIIRFDGTSAPAELASALATTDHLLVSVPPGQDGDPVLRRCGDMLARATRMKSIVY